MTTKDWQPDLGALDAWLWKEVVPVYDKVMADPSQCIPAETVFAELRAHHERQQKQPP